MLHPPQARLRSASPKRTALRFAGAIAAGIVLALIVSWGLILLGFVVGMAMPLFLGGIAVCFFGAGWLAGASLDRGRRARVGFGLGALLGLPLLVVPVFSVGMGYSGQELSIWQVVEGVGILGSFPAAGFGIMGAVGGLFLGEGWRAAGSCALRFILAGALGGALGGAIIIAGLAMTETVGGAGMIVYVAGGATYFLLPAAIGGWLLSQRLALR